MKLPPVAYHCADTMEDAVSVLEREADARVLAGGQSLLPLMALRMSAPALLVDITRARDLQGFAVTDRRVCFLDRGTVAEEIEAAALTDRDDLLDQYLGV